MSSNHATTTVKYCTPSASCNTWNCSCDRHIRAEQAFKPLLGALIVFTEEPQYSYFLPLSPCLEKGATSRSSSEQAGYGEAVIPLTCETRLAERWAALRALLNSRDLVKVIFNSQLTLLPVIHQLFVTPPSNIEDTTVTPSVFAQLNNIADPKIAAYIHDSEISEGQLEVNSLFAANAIDLMAIKQNMVVGMSGQQLGRVAAAMLSLHCELRGMSLLLNSLYPRLQQCGMGKCFRELEMPMAVILSLMEYQGIHISVDRIATMHTAISSQIKCIESQAVTSVGQPFNLASPEQVAHILYDVLKLPPPKQAAPFGNSGATTVAGKPKKHLSTGEEDLKVIAHTHPVVDLILSFRGLSKCVSTNIEGIRPFILASNSIGTVVAHEEPEDIRTFFGQPPLAASSSSTLRSTGAASAVAASFAAKATFPKVHAYWKQTNVRTGRLSCSKPNLQNIPTRTKISGIDINVRSMFVAAEGFVLVSADYSQIEMRVLAHVSKDAAMIHLFDKGGDIYVELAAGEVQSRDATLNPLDIY
jgi:DNA polymerase family A